MTISIRDCTPGDVDAMAEMAEARRVAYEAYEPLFWKKAENSAELGRAFFGYLVGQADNLCLLAERGGEAEGFLIATPARVPPVYEPGATAMIDDFCVAEPGLWESVGPELMIAARARLRQRGFAQIVVVCGHKDAAKTRFLETQDLSLTSTWWTAPA